jgi:type IV pilus assembly protein PilE
MGYRPTLFLRQRGFTLIELLIVVAITAVLARIAFVSYSTSVAKSRRNAAQGCLMEQAQYIERVYTTNLSYATAALPSVNAQQCQANLSTLYTFTLPTLTTTTFTVAATAIGAQASADAACTPMTVDQTGSRTPAAGCW